MSPLALQRRDDRDRQALECQPASALVKLITTEAPKVGVTTSNADLLPLPVRNLVHKREDLSCLRKHFHVSSFLQPVSQNWAPVVPLQPKY